MDDRYDHYGDPGAMRNKSEVTGARKIIASRKIVLKGSAISTAYVRVRTQIDRLVDRVTGPLFAQLPICAHFSGTGLENWDGSLVGWLIEGQLKVQDRNFSYPPDAPITNYKGGDPILTVFVSRDRGRKLCVSGTTVGVERAIEGVKVVLSYLHEHIRSVEKRSVDQSAALHCVEGWIRTPLVEQHLRCLTEEFLPGPVRIGGGALRTRTGIEK